MTSSTLADRLDDDFAPAWRPEPGEKLVGEVVAISERAGQYDTYPIVTVRQDDGIELAFHAFHTVAANELAKQRPRLGERIGIKYTGQRDGQSGATYHAYKMQVDRGEVAVVDWDKYGDPTASETPQPELPSHLSGYGQPAKPEDTGDDIPF